MKKKYKNIKILYIYIYIYIYKYIFFGFYGVSFMRQKETQQTSSYLKIRKRTERLITINDKLEKTSL